MNSKIDYWTRGKLIRRTSKHTFLSKRTNWVRLHCSSRQPMKESFVSLRGVHKKKNSDIENGTRIEPVKIGGMPAIIIDVVILHAVYCT